MENNSFRIDSAGVLPPFTGIEYYSFAPVNSVDWLKYTDDICRNIAGTTAGFILQKDRHPVTLEKLDDE